MKTGRLGRVLLVGGCLFMLPVWLSAQENPPKTSPPASADTSSDDEASIRESAHRFTEDFNRHDAKAVASYWTEDGVYTSETGERFVGRESIQHEYESIFAMDDALALELEIDSIRLINANTAIEEGRSAIRPQPAGADRVMSVYEAVHVKQNGRWLMASVRDMRVDVPAIAERLDALEWLIGTWTAGEGVNRVDVRFQWIQGHRFIARSHKIKGASGNLSSSLQIIGLDPATNLISSWSFTSDGSHAQAQWDRFEGGWVEQSVGVTNDGTPTVATNILTRKDDDTVIWKSVDRTLGDSRLPDTDVVTLKRAP